MNSVYASQENNMKKKIAAVSLGCSKNRVDTELMLGMIPEYEMTDDISRADVILINTCGFIEAAKTESIETILEVSEMRKDGSILIVAGCLSERYRDELERELPEVDAFLGIHGYNSIRDAISEAGRKKHFSEYTDNDSADFLTRVVTTGSSYAYVRIADGCDNFCSYCAIPYIRGPYKSRDMNDIESEVRSLVDKGYREIILVAQDTSKYGIDLYGRPVLKELLERLSDIDGLIWLRILYSYPEDLTKELLDVIVNKKNIVNYIDMPIQHTSDRILEKMNRSSFSVSEKAIELIRSYDTEFVIRTTILTGFPGEDEEDLEKLKDDIKRIRFDRLGVFAFSSEDGTPAASLEGQLPSDVKEKRADELMALQAVISNEKCHECIGRRYTAVIENAVDGGYEGRTEYQVPDVDGILYIKTDRELTPGSYISVVITDADDYDLYSVPEDEYENT